MDDSRAYVGAACIIFTLGMAVGMIWMSEHHGEAIEKQKQYCLSQCEKLTKDKGELIECSYGCKKAAEHTKIGE